MNQELQREIKLLRAKRHNTTEVSEISRIK